MHSKADSDITFVIKDSKRQSTPIRVSTAQMNYLQTTQAFCWLCGCTGTNLSQWNQFMLRMSLAFLGVAKMKHSPKPASMAYVKSNGSGTCTCTASDGWLQWGRKLAIHTYIPGEAGLNADTQKVCRLSNCSRWKSLKAGYISCWKFLTFHD